MKVLELAPEARKCDPARRIPVQSTDAREDATRLRWAADVALSRVVHGKWKPAGTEKVDHLLREAGGVDRMDPRRELVGVRPDRDVDDRVRVEPRGQDPVTPFAQAVLAVTDVEWGLGLGEDDVDDLPVAFVRLPEEVAGGYVYE